jgi:hypothetical protein
LIVYEGQLELLRRIHDIWGINHYRLGDPRVAKGELAIAAQGNKITRCSSSDARLEPGYLARFQLLPTLTRFQRVDESAMVNSRGHIG